MECFVYCLATIKEPIFTYVGATIDLDRRLAQHNKLYVGGAKATSKRPGEWYRVCYVAGFTSWRQALSFEWHWKYNSRKLRIHGQPHGPPLERRQLALDKTLLWAENTSMPGLTIHYD